MLISGLLNQVKMHRVHVGAYTHNARSGLLGQVEAGHSGVSQESADMVSCHMSHKLKVSKSQVSKTWQDAARHDNDVARRGKQGRAG